MTQAEHEWGKQAVASLIARCIEALRQQIADTGRLE